MQAAVSLAADVCCATPMISERLLKFIFEDQHLLCFLFAAAWMGIISTFAFDLCRCTKALRIAGLCLVNLAFWLYFAGIEMNWVWRDGLGPDSVESHGELAVGRFMEAAGCDTRVFLGFVAGLWGLVFVIGSRQRRRARLRLQTQTLKSSINR